jgi:hypothetical protein
LNLQPIAVELTPSERRREPRVATTRNALIRLTATLTFRCQVRNLSLSGGQVLCDPRYALLVRQGHLVDLSIAVPFAGGVRSMTASCRASYRLAVDGGTPDSASGMLMGLEFATVESASRQMLADFVDSLLGSDA